MRILPVSEFSYKNNGVNFSSKNDEKPESLAKVKNVAAGAKKAVPTAALILAMMADPIATQKSEAAQLTAENTETQWIPPYYAPFPPYIYYPFLPPPVFYPYDFYAPPMIMMNYLQNITELNNVYTKPVSPVAVGNVTFNKDDVKAVNAYSYDDVQYHNVVLNNGTNVTFPLQDEENYAVVYRDGNGYVFEGLSNAFIAGSKNRDKYILNGCRNTVIDVSDDNKIDRVLIQRYRITPANERQYTDNVAVTAGSGDVVNNRLVQNDGEITTYSGY